MPRKQPARSDDSGYSKAKKPGGKPIGLSNLGNTCYFNSVIQPLCHTYLLNEELKYVGQKGKLIDSFDDSVHRMQHTDARSFDPTEVREQFVKRVRRFDNHRQHDGHECLRHFLDEIRKEERKMKDSSSDKDQLTTVDKIFGGHLITVYICKECDKHHHLFEPCLDISLPVFFESEMEIYPIHKESLALASNQLDLTDVKEDKGVKTEWLPPPMTNTTSKKNKGESILKCLIPGCLSPQHDSDAESKHGRNSWSEKSEIKVDGKPKDSLNCDTDGCPEGNQANMVNKKEIASEQSIHKLKVPLSGAGSSTGHSFDKSSRDSSVKRKELHTSFSRSQDNTSDAYDENSKTYRKKNHKYEDQGVERYKRSVKELTNRLSYPSIDHLTDQSSRNLKGIISLDVCLNHFSREENIHKEYLCNDCLSEAMKKGEATEDNLKLTSASKLTLIFNPPAVLTIHFKRFELLRGGSKKRSDMVKYPELLDLAPYCSSQCLRNDPPRNNIWYSLYAVVVHSGSLESGHYVSYVRVRESKKNIKEVEKFIQREYFNHNDELKNMKFERKGERTKTGKPERDESKWFLLNDSSVSRVELDEVLRQEAYLLFYERVDGMERGNKGAGAEARPQARGFDKSPHSSLPPKKKKGVTEGNYHERSSTLASNPSLPRPLPTLTRVNTTSGSYDL